MRPRPEASTLPAFGWRAAARLGAALLALAAVLVALRRHPGAVEWLANEVGALGAAAALVLPALYVPWVVLGIPAAPLAAAAGFALGPYAGGAVATLGYAVGATAAYAVARAIARPAVERLAARVPAVDVVRRAVAVRGFRVLLLLRLAPVMPIPFLNHVLGVSSLRLPSFVAATVLGGLPNACFAAAIGALLRAAGARIDEGALALHGAPLAAAAAASLALGALAVRSLRRELGAAARDAGPRAPPGGSTAA